MSDTKTELKNYLGLIYQIASHDPQFDTPANREKIWAFVKDKIPAEQQKLIDAAENPDEKLLTLNLILLKLIQEPDFSLPPDLNELVAQYEKHQDQKEQDLEIKAAHMATTKKSLLDQQLAALKQIGKLDSVAQEVATDLILEPEKTIASLSQIFPPEELAPIIPLTPSPVVENIFLTLKSSPDFPEPSVAAAATILKIKNPQSSPDEFKELFRRLTLASEVSRQTLNIPESAAQTAAQLTIPPSTDLLDLSLQNQFLKSNLSPAEAISHSATLKTFVPLLNTIALNASETNDPREVSAFKISSARVYFSNEIVQYLGWQKISFTNSAQYYGREQITSASQLNQDQKGWLSSFVDLGKDKITDKVVSAAWQKFAASEIGKKALTSAGIKIGTAAATEGAAAVTGAALAPETMGLSLLIPLAFEAVKNLWSRLKRVVKEFPEVAGVLVGGLAVIPFGISPILGGVGGAGAAFIIKNGASSLQAAGNAVTTGSSALVGLVATEIAAPIVITLISIPIVVALLLFIINTSAFVVPPGNSPGFIGYPFSGPGGSISCDPPHEPLGFSNTATNSITSRAWQIVDRLERGFWCYWNKSPDYPELFDTEKIRFNPNPNRYEYTNLFWCTWLVVKAYNESGQILPLKYNGSYTLASDVMLQWFKDQGRYVEFKDAQKARFTNISPGDVAFVYTGGDGRDVQHVSIVWFASQGSIQTIDSNAGLKSFTYSISAPNKKACWGSSCAMHIIGFGKKI